MLVVIFEISHFRIIGSKPNLPYTYRESNAIVALDIVTSRVTTCRHATLILLVVDSNPKMLEIAYTRRVFTTTETRWNTENDATCSLSIDNSCPFYKYLAL